MSKSFDPTVEQHSGYEQAAEPAKKQGLWILLALALTLALLVYTFWDGLQLMVQWWGREEYSHGFMIPFVSGFLIYQRLNTLPIKLGGGSWWGPILMVVALALYLVGEMSAIYTVIQYGFLLAVYALVLSLFGTSGFRHLLVPLVYLVFMIPLPNFIYFNLSSQLQLLSSQIGVSIIRLFDIAVYLEGNVIDLGAMKLQVVEACSGLRYLFPLMSFGFLVACIYRAPLWQRVVIFLSTIPITVLMNSLRIGLIGVTVDQWGIAMAEGFLHDFEGWIVFMGCIGVLFLEALVMYKLSRFREPMIERLQIDIPRLTVSWKDFQLKPSKRYPLFLSILLVFALSPWLVTLQGQEEVAPERNPLALFPLKDGNWVGREHALDQDVLQTLQLSDYILADYRNTTAFLTDPSVNFYVAWYSSQKKGASIHSPRSCIPGGGWRMDELEQFPVEDVTHASGAPLHVNRAVIRKGAEAQLVYYWFEGRGRNITNEFLAKWYIFVDSLTKSRSDGALVRVTTRVPEGASVDQADIRLKKFLSDFYPKLSDYTP